MLQGIKSSPVIFMTLLIETGNLQVLYLFVCLLCKHYYFFISYMCWMYKTYKDIKCYYTYMVGKLPHIFVAFFLW